MKKGLLTMLVIVAMVLLFSMPLFAQTSMTFGPKAGLSLAKLTGDDIGDVDWKIGFSGGAFLGIGVSPTLTVQPELVYVMKGAKETDMGVDYKYKVNYVEVPILVKWTAPTEGSVKPNVFFGVAPAFLMSAKISGDSAGVSAELDIKDEVKSVDFGAVIGGGLDFPAGSGTVCFDVRYTLGLTKIDDTGADADVKNSALSASLGFAIPIGAKP